jgi:hypothetical protein
MGTMGRGGTLSRVKPEPVTTGGSLSPRHWLLKAKSGILPAHDQASP